MPEDGPRRLSPLRNALRVLVVEDDALIAMMYAELLVETGYAVCAIETTQAGTVAAVGRDKPDLMIVDAGLRDGSGISAVAEILRSGFIPHLFVTGDPGAVLASRPGAVILQKPFRDSELAQAAI
jgi:DNA-binding response OmpR family regulator